MAIELEEQEKLVGIYRRLRQEVIDHGYSFEIEWQNSRELSDLSETEFIQESAWVILSTGMKESIIRNIFSEITSAFMNWESAFEITRNANICETKALEVFRNYRKISAILSLCNRVHECGFETIKQLIIDHGVTFLKEFDFIGPVTCYHLAKNIGLNVVKPDRHLVRIANVTKVNDPNTLCHIISSATGDKLAVVDIVLWRYATLNEDYLTCFEYED